jgi:hypothetical protein
MLKYVKVGKAYVIKTEIGYKEAGKFHSRYRRVLYRIIA